MVYSSAIKKKNEMMSFARKMLGTGVHQAEREKPNPKSEVSHVLANLWNLDLQ
jgi:hypothetical protein